MIYFLRFSEDYKLCINIHIHTFQNYLKSPQNKIMEVFMIKIGYIMRVYQTHTLYFEYRLNNL